MAFAENHADGGSSTFADDGTASHEWAASCLTDRLDAIAYFGHVQALNGKSYTMDEDRGAFVQMYLDDVRRRAIGGKLFVEYRVDLSEYLGEGQGGTADALIYMPATKTLIVEDLKYGTGEKVSAIYERKINPQLGLYLLGALKDIELMGYCVERVKGVICQPRLHHVDEHTITVSELMNFADLAAEAVVKAGEAMADAAPGRFLVPGEKQCRWCRAKAVCPALTKFVADEVRMDFDDIVPADAPRDVDKLSKAYTAMPLIEQWCKAVSAEVHRLTAAGTPVNGPDGLPYKFVEGKEGARKWANEQEAEDLLLQNPLIGPERAYAPQKVITAPQAAKLLDKKATKETWKDVFEPLIIKPRGQPKLVPGSDPRPPFVGSADMSEFEELGVTE